MVFLQERTDIRDVMYEMERMGGADRKGDGGMNKKCIWLRHMHHKREALANSLMLKGVQQSVRCVQQPIPKFVCCPKKLETAIRRDVSHRITQYIYYFTINISGQKTQPAKYYPPAKQSEFQFVQTDLMR